MEDLLTRAYRLINLYNSTGRRPCTYAGGETLYPAQIHFLECLSQDEGETLSVLSRKLYISRSAASQTVALLEDKGFLVKADPVGTGGAQCLYLSEKGRDAVKEHRLRHKSITYRLGAVLQGMDVDTRKQIVEMLDIIEEEIGENYGIQRNG